jgi:hypothetical protein
MPSASFAAENDPDGGQSQLKPNYYDGAPVTPGR